MLPCCHTATTATTVDHTKPVCTVTMAMLPFCHHCHLYKAISVTIHGPPLHHPDHSTDLAPGTSEFLPSIATRPPKRGC
eukprot:scaffold181206_cov22-Tisochrysis_lutea.AAC.3